MAKLRIPRALQQREDRQQSMDAPTAPTSVPAKATKRIRKSRAKHTDGVHKGQDAWKNIGPAEARQMLNTLVERQVTGWPSTYAPSLTEVGKTVGLSHHHCRAVLELLKANPDLLEALRQRGITLVHGSQSWQPQAARLFISDRACRYVAPVYQGSPKSGSLTDLMASLRSHGTTQQPSAQRESLLQTPETGENTDIDHPEDYTRVVGTTSRPDEWSWDMGWQSDFTVYRYA